MRTPLLAFVWLLVQCNIAFSQNTERSFLAQNRSGNEVIVMVTDGEYHIVPVNEQTFHVKFLPKGKEVRDLAFGAVPQPTFSDFEVVENTQNLLIKTSGIEVEVTKNPFQLQFFYRGELVTQEFNGYQQTDSLMMMSLKLEEDEILYGGGARVLGMNRRGNRLQLYNRAHYGYETRSELMNYSLPVVVSSKKYALFFDNASSAFLDLDSKGNNELVFESAFGTMNYYVVVGNDWYDLTSQFTALTGRQPLPPRWVFGNFSSRFGYHSQNEVLTTINKFFADSIPVDAVIIDIYWFGPGIFDYMGNLNWYRDSFPEPQRMIDELKSKGVKTVLVTEPFILTTSDRWNEAVANDILGKDSAGNPYTYNFYFGNTGLIDAFKPKAANWFWNIYKQFTSQGIGGWWGDLGEPEVHPSGLLHVNGSADEVHNAYGHQWAKIIYEGYRNDFPNQRPFILMRAGYAGSQRYGMIPWTGDVNRSWGGLVPQPEISLQMGMQGVAYMHSDLGGFAGGDSIDNELYARWLQYGVFQPVYRPHAQEHIPSEPVFQTEETKALVKKSIDLRYRLKPYIYSMAFENSQSGKPLMIPLFFNEPENSTLLEYSDAYMWGDAFLVSPVKERGKTQQQVYLPANSNWTNFFTGEAHTGGAEVTVDLSINHIPVFVKGGSFIPMVPKATNEQNYSLCEFDMHYYVDDEQKSSAYRLYNDDGKTPDSFEKRMYEFVEFKATQSDSTLVLKIDMVVGENYSVEKKLVNMVLHNIRNEPKEILVNETIVEGTDYIFIESDNRIHFKIELRQEPKKIEIRF
ncbi:MAG TPA: glycoside hydrolase family 31 protein [Tenuifilaceae bacterium]|nr:glycoside hydrolase family 31 protein [Tenuifilaceae bacterium]